MNENQVDPRKFQWRIIIPLVTIVVIVCIWWFYCWFQIPTTVFVVRHADKLSPTADVLSSAGVARANELKYVLGSTGIVAIYHSATMRAEATAEPLATHLGITLESYPRTAITQLVSDIIGDHRGERVFVVGHTDTVPDILEALGGVPTPDLSENVYDDLFVVTKCPCTSRWPVIINTKYGADTLP